MKKTKSIETTKSIKKKKNVKENTRKYDRTKNLVSFTSTRQPSPEAKKKGWDARRAKLEKFKILEKFANYSYKDIREMVEKSVKDKTVFDKFTLQEVMTIKYMSKTANWADYLNRCGVKVKEEIDITTDGKPLNYTVKIINGNTSNDSSPKDTGSGEGL